MLFNKLCVLKFKVNVKISTHLVQFSEYVSFPRFDLDLDLDLDLDMVVDISLFNVKNKYYDQ